MKKALKGLYLTLIVLFLYLPIGTLMVLSFNSGKTMNAWTGFSLDWYEEMFQSQQIMGSPQEYAYHSVLGCDHSYDNRCTAA